MVEWSGMDVDDDVDHNGDDYNDFDYDDNEYGC